MRHPRMSPPRCYLCDEQGDHQRTDFGAPICDACASVWLDKPEPPALDYEPTRDDDLPWPRPTPRWPPPLPFTGD